MELVASAARAVDHVQVDRCNRKRCSYLNVYDQAQPASKPFLRAPEVVFASGKPNDPRVMKRMPSQDGVAVERGCVGRVCQFQVLDSVDGVRSQALAKLFGNVHVSGTGDAVVDFVQQDQVREAKEWVVVQCI